jgi:hypothetical protein
MEIPEYLRPLRRELIKEQITRWDRQRIVATWPRGYDLSQVNRLSGDPAIELRAITGA